MNREEVVTITQELFRAIFDDSHLVIADTMTANDVEEWDSLNHINLLSSLERAFKIRFALGELNELKNVGAMINLILKKLTN